MGKCWCLLVSIIFMVNSHPYDIRFNLITIEPVLRKIDCNNNVFIVEGWKSHEQNTAQGLFKSLLKKIAVRNICMFWSKYFKSKKKKSKSSLCAVCCKLVMCEFWLNVCCNRYATDQQGLQLPLSVPSGGVENHPTGQPEEHQAHSWRASLPGHRSDVSKVFTESKILLSNSKIGPVPSLRRSPQGLMEGIMLMRVEQPTNIMFPPDCYQHITNGTKTNWGIAHKGVTPMFSALYGTGNIQ